MLLTPDTKLTARDIEHFLLAASFGRVGQEHHYASKWAKSATLTTLTDEATGHICGLAATYMNRPTHDYAYLTYIAVLPANRGGQGKRLLLSVLQQAAGLHFKRLRLEVAKTNAVALHLYRSCGFTVTAETDTSYYMERTLP